MNLIPEPPEVPLATKQAIAIEERRKSALDALKKTTADLFNNFWYPNEGVTPQQIANVFGTNAIFAFTQHAETVAFLTSQGIELEEKYKVPPYAYVVASDGSVVISDP